MSSSSSDSDSDEFEPIRKIKINIRPKEEAVKRGAADVNEIKASVRAWRPLGPPTHPSLTRRQSSLSSVSSMTFGTSNSVYGSNHSQINPSMNQDPLIGASMRSSPSCSSLVNEFNNRSSFSNFMSTTSRTSSPLTLLNNSDPVPIAIAIQESIELIIKGHYDPNAKEPKFNSRYLGNIKVAFPNAFARVGGNIIGGAGKQQPMTPLKMRLHSTENIIRYYGSRLIKDLDLGTTANNSNSVAESTDAFSSNNISTNNNQQSKLTSISNGDNNSQQKKQNSMNLTFDPFEDQTKQSNASSTNSSASVTNQTLTNSKVIEFDMDALVNHLKKLYDQSPTSRYYNVDVLRYQIAPIRSIEECPLQVCAYWKVEADLVKLRIDFKHSSKSGLNLERLREINFTVNFSQFIPPGVEVNSLSPDSISTLRLNNNNNNNSGAMNMNNFESATNSTANTIQRIISGGGTSSSMSLIDADNIFGSKTMTLIGENPLPPLGSGSHRVNNSSNGQQQKPTNINNLIPPYITYEPQAHWNNSIKQLTWKFDTLLSYYKSDGLGSLFAKLDYRNYHGLPTKFLENSKPTPVDVKFLVIDSTVSKLSLSIDSMGYKMSLLKKEIRSGRYKSEPYIL